MARRSGFSGIFGMRCVADVSGDRGYPTFRTKRRRPVWEGRDPALLRDSTTVLQIHCFLLFHSDHFVLQEHSYHSKNMQLIKFRSESNILHTHRKKKAAKIAKITVPVGVKTISWPTTSLCFLPLAFSCACSHYCHCGGRSLGAIFLEMLRSLISPFMDIALHTG